MKFKIINILKYLLFIMIPFFSVIINIAFQTAQGEKNEEIIFGIMVGIVMDLVYAMVLWFMDRRSNKTE